MEPFYFCFTSHLLTFYLLKTGSVVLAGSVCGGSTSSSAAPIPGSTSDTPDRGGVSAYRVRGGMFTPAPRPPPAQDLQNPVLLPKLESQKV